VFGFAIKGICLRYMNIKAIVVYKIAKDLCGKCVGTLSAYIFQFFLMKWVSDFLLMRIVAKDIQGIVKFMTVNCLQLKTCVGIIVYMDNKVKSKNFVIFMMLNV